MKGKKEKKKGLFNMICLVMLNKPSFKPSMQLDSGQNEKGLTADDMATTHK